VTVMYFMVQSCLHVVSNFLRPPEPGQNILYLSPCRWPVLNSVKFRKNVEIPQKQANSTAWLKIPYSVGNSGH